MAMEHPRPPRRPPKPSPATKPVHSAYSYGPGSRGAVSLVRRTHVIAPPAIMKRSSSGSKKCRFTNTFVRIARRTSKRSSSTSSRRLPARNAQASGTRYSFRSSAQPIAPQAGPPADSLVEAAVAAAGAVAPATKGTYLIWCSCASFPLCLRGRISDRC
jgi:hypothetical protein